MNFFPVILWWLIIQCLGWLALPVVYPLMRWLPDRGYVFSKAVGLLLVSYLVWLGASTGWLRNNLSGILTAIMVLSGISLWLLLKVKEEDGRVLYQSLKDFLLNKRSLVLVTEVLFIVALFSWSILRAYASFKIQPAGGEKFMEIAFLNGILNSPNFPPIDPWLSNFTISYYYFGYVMMAILTRLSGVTSGVGFDLYDALLFALTLTGIFGVIYNLVAGTDGGKVKKYRTFQPIGMGLIGVLLVGMMGNLEGILESLRTGGLLSTSFLQWINIPNLANVPITGVWDPSSAKSPWFWWWRASRILQDRDLSFQPIGNSPITEFPIFSFLLGDNHPHVLALPFGLLCIVLGLNLLRWQITIGDTEFKEGAAWWNPILTVFRGNGWLFVFYAFCFGALGFLNTWDMPVYISLVTLTVGVGEYYNKRRLDRFLILKSLAFCVGLSIGAFFLYIFFYMGFSSQAGGILPYILPPTRLSQYLIIFGVFLFIIICYLIMDLLGWLHHNDGCIKRRVILLLRTWSVIIFVCGALFGIAIFYGLIMAGLKGMFSGGADISLVTGITEEINLFQVLFFVILSRISDPWLFLTLTLLLGLVVSHLFIKTKSPLLIEVGNPEQNTESTVSDIYFLLMIFVGVTLTFCTEFFYLRDGFGVRLNTVFKFYYQGWILLGCASAYALWQIFNNRISSHHKSTGTIILTVSLILIMAGLTYPWFAIPDRAQYLISQPNMDGASQIANDNPDDWAAIEWFRQNVIPSTTLSTEHYYPTTLDIPVILEAPGGSYSYEGRISAFTGLPTVLGWEYHEGQWRGNMVEQDRRRPDIQTIYTTTDPQKALILLKKYHVQYVILGTSEQNYIHQLICKNLPNCNVTRSLRKFDIILKSVFQQGPLTIYKMP